MAKMVKIEIEVPAEQLDLFGEAVFACCVSLPHFVINQTRQIQHVAEKLGLGTAFRPPLEQLIRYAENAQTAGNVVVTLIGQAMPVQGGKKGPLQ